MISSASQNTCCHCERPTSPRRMPVCNASAHPGRRLLCQVQGAAELSPRRGERADRQLAGC
jgi:hypothetical protein